MTENIIKPTTINGFSFKASGKVRKRSFMSKIVSHKVTVFDAFESRFRSSISIFIPKLHPRYVKPHLMLHVSNGASSCLIRFKNPDELVKALEKIIDKIHSDKWTEAWWRVSDVSENLIADNKIVFDEEIVDINAWNDALKDTIDVELVQIKKEEGGEI